MSDAELLAGNERLGEVGDVRRFPTKHHFAAHTGTAPLEASSGQVIRHRLSQAGDRKLNHALYLMAIVQIRHPTAGQVYYRRKRAEGQVVQGSAALPETAPVGRCLPVPARRSARPAAPGGYDRLITSTRSAWWVLAGPLPDPPDRNLALMLLAEAQDCFWRRCARPWSASSTRTVSADALSPRRTLRRPVWLRRVAELGALDMGKISS